MSLFCPECLSEIEPGNHLQERTEHRELSLSPRSLHWFPAAIKALRERRENILDGIVHAITRAIDNGEPPSPEFLGMLLGMLGQVGPEIDQVLNCYLANVLAATKEPEDEPEDEEPVS